MVYLIVIFIIIIIVGILANQELARDRERIRQMIREYSFRRYSPNDREKEKPENESQEK